MNGPRRRNIPQSAFLRGDEDGPFIRRRCVVEYDGTEFCGFQAQDQPGSMRTVQETIEDALSRTTGEMALPRLRFASRTDTGVHALGQVVVFSSQCIESDCAFRDALNTRLPKDILCRSLTTMSEAEANFDPCADATLKRYVYELVSGGLRPVPNRKQVWHVRKPLNIANMQAAVEMLMAPPTTKDFSSFTPQKTTDGDKGNICTVSTIELHAHKLDGEGDAQYEEDVSTRIQLVFEGNRFRYKMVRNLVGTIVDIGLGKLNPNDIPAILAAKSRAKAGQEIDSECIICSDKDI
ncbi:hypothetical protein BBO99_00003253 [Phytophthora kernoviae]|uniref:tRNA pseudouridine synthase n=2 Tax=Phytophthora kernoviae TaxID=325452 RepID=A0A3R7KLF9_9STRA|nr:hypothetical protein G195_001124 [Phytophthora kernoviae 00238/432]KAG2528417.1 hypothetical protein JM16_002841 [Phytophthora kernoviae]KAG2529940.1 hypothetical protein JM18_002472 [Phytophthora kernoviae]RLN44727.1 hypothetical protein BBI17_003231 [Phytophthora kernoviae]RLN82001.1 hypothetical protein BBO99_00003253 [Phytophthora kernoviae]